MANPAGLNQDRIAYGDVKKQMELTREAPMSGAPVSGRALASPQKAQRRAVRPNRTATVPAIASGGPAQAALPAPQQQAPVAQQAPASPSQQVAMEWRVWAAMPDASPLVQMYARQAQQEAAGGG